jgi:SAM-dependent methyltransferase
VTTSLHAISPPPDFLSVQKPHQSNPGNTELGHTTSTERALYQALRDEVLELHSILRRPLAVLDACCASGGCARNVIPPDVCSKLVLLDNDPAMCSAARSRAWRLPSVTVVEADAVMFRADLQFDLILVNSAYHHIADTLKAAFLRNMASHLVADGRMLVGEHFLPDYTEGSLVDYRTSVVAFYSSRIDDLLTMGDAPEAVDVIRQTGRYCWEREYEYQVSQRVFQEHVDASAMVVESITRLWPGKDDNRLPLDSGTFCIRLAKCEQVN